jgi:hypothetical protein
MQLRSKDTSATTERLCFLFARSYLEDTWRYSSLAGYSPDGNGLTTEAKESPLLDSLPVNF